MGSDGIIKYIDQEVGESTIVESINAKGTFLKEAAGKDLSVEIGNFIADMKTKEGKGYLLIAAMTDENWGQNNNGDYFPTKALANDTKEYGHKTFEHNAMWYRSHKNKDPKKSYGKVIFSYFNPKMARVELIVEYDLEKDDWTRDALAKGKDIRVSMGTKVSFDVCSICHPGWREFYNIPIEDMNKIAQAKTIKEIHDIGEKNKLDLSYITKLNDGGGALGIATNSNKYCDHIKYSKGKTMPDGRKVFMVNMYPLFFDISNLTSPDSVGRPADRSAVVLAKVAKEDETIKTVDELNLNNKGAENKDAEIEKQVEGEVLSGDDEKVKEYMNNFITPTLRENEPDLPNDVLDELAGFGMDKIISTMMGLGMSPKPKEFQRITLIIQGKEGLADKYEQDGMFINDSDVDRMMRIKSIVNEDRSPYNISGDNISDDIIKLLEPFIGQKSYHSKPMVSRIIMIKKADAISTPLNPPSSSRGVLPTSLLAIAAYMGLAKLTGSKAMVDVMKTMWENKWALMGSIAGAMALTEVGKSVESEYDAYKKDQMPKTAALSPKAIKTLALTTLGITPLSYIYGQHQINRANRGERISNANRFIAKHPGATAIGGIMLSNKLPRKAVGSVLGMPVKWLFKRGMEDMVKQGMGFEGMEITKYAAEDQARVVTLLWDTIAKVDDGKIT